MSTLKIILRTKENKDGTRPLAVRVTKDRKSSYIYLGHNLIPEHWDEKNQRVKKTHPNSSRMNGLLSKRFAEINEKLLELEMQKTDTSSQSIKKGVKASKEASFFGQANIYLQDLKAQGKFNRLSADKPRVERFKEFLNGVDVSFTEIDTSLIKKFSAYLKRTRDITDRTVVNHLIVLRTIFNQAISAKIVEAKHYPFGKDKIVIRFPESLKIGLTREEVQSLEQLDLTKLSSLDNARDMWLLSFYFAGMRVSDVLRLKWSDFQNDRLFYTMGKNNKVGSLKVSQKVLDILEKYKRPNAKHNLVFPDLETVDDFSKSFEIQKRIAICNKRINDNLDRVTDLIGLNKKLTMHIARHTFGNLSGDKIPIQMLQKLYRHTSITTTIGYQANFINKDADDALEAVIGF